MPDTTTLDRRLAAVERALTDSDRDLTELQAAADAVDGVEALESRVDDLDDRVAELEAAVQAIRGYVGSVRAVNQDVEDRADEALALARSLQESNGDDQAGHATTGEDRSEPSTGPRGDCRPGDSSPPTGRLDDPWTDADTDWRPIGGDDTDDETRADTVEQRDDGSNWNGDAIRESGERDRVSCDPDHDSGWNWTANQPREPATAEESETTERPSARRERASEHHPQRNDRERPVESREDAESRRDGAGGAASLRHGFEAVTGEETVDRAANAETERGSPTRSDGGRDGRRRGDGSWPPGENLDVDRAQPWTAPEFPTDGIESTDEDEGLLERIRDRL